MDLFAAPQDRDEVNPFIQLLWEKGALHEQNVIGDVEEPFLDLSIYAGEEKERLTAEAMARGEPLIYGGRIAEDDLLGDPDLLRKRGDGYVAGDIKSGAGLEGSEDLSKPKIHYAVQIALYTDILERKGLSGGRIPFIWDVHGDEVVYALDEPQGVKNPKTLWSTYEDALNTARQLVTKSEDSLPAYSGTCRLCHWYSACQKRLGELDDLTLIPDLGRSKRDTMVAEIATANDLAKADVSQFITGKKTVFQGIGPDSLHKFQQRAKLIKSDDPKPYLTSPVSLPHSDLELFFDIETDPMRDICYLHGFVERHNGDNSTERYVAFFAEDVSNDSEEKAFANAWSYFQRNAHGIIYYYSKYERTIWRKLREKYPDVCTEQDIEDLFDPARSIDLYYDIVKKATEWPTKDHSIKTLAKYLGFNWRDTHPSGAASIQWFDEWITTNDATVKQRILEYNEDDCVATRVLLDGIRALS
jgi:predicted RecB family nuclease